MFGSEEEEIYYNQVTQFQQNSIITQYPQPTIQQPGLYVPNPQHDTAHNINGYYPQTMNDQYMEHHIQMPPQTKSLPLNLSQQTNNDWRTQYNTKRLHSPEEEK